MSARFLISKLRLTALLLLCSVVGFLYGGDTTWTDGVTPNNTALLPNVVFDGTGSSGVITLDRACVTVQTFGTNVTVTMLGDTIIQGAAGGGSTLIFDAAAGNTITVVMNFNLTFRGSPSGAPADLLFIVRGQGEVVFQMDGGETLTLTANPTTGGRVQMYRQLINAAGLNQMTFTRNPADPSPNSDVTVVVEKGSLLSYISLFAQPTASVLDHAVIRWNTTNAAGSGRMLLTIGALGAVIVRARLLDTGALCPTLANIHPETPAGFDASFTVVNNNAAFSGSLLVQNNNNTLGEFIWDPWGNLGVRTNPPFGSFDGVQWGFIVGSYGNLNVNAASYFDYVSLTSTQCPVVPPLTSSQVKARNPSALFTDGQPDPTFLAPHINIAANAGVFFRSGVDNQGRIVNPWDGSDSSFTIDPTQRTPGAGFPVFDIEGPLVIQGANSGGVQRSGIELLSLEVDPTGGSLFVGDGQTIFPLRTFATETMTDPCTGIDAVRYVSYNNACFLNNGRVDLQDVSIIHTDQNHYVFENNDTASEPAYIGGESWLLFPCMAKPKWAFYNSVFNVQTSVALTGVDLLVPNGSDDLTPCGSNLSMFLFYQNGKAVDHGNGRNMILGTFIGSTACDGCTVLNKDAQLDVMQDQACDVQPAGLQELQLGNGVNDHTIIEAIPTTGIDPVLLTQYSIQTIYLGNNSNISVGTQGTFGTTMSVTTQTQSTFPLTTFPVLTINGNFFSFETRGGENGLPATSNVTGQGGIFVDTNGTFQVGSLVCGYRTNIGAMVTKSSNGVIDLPVNRVFLDPTIGIATWNINLNDPAQWVIVPNGVEYAEYNLNWMFTTKDYNLFMPYYLTDCYNPCVCPPVIPMNVTAIPTVEGVVQQFNVQGSRIGDPIHLKVNGGTIQELVMLVGFNSAEAPVAVLVLENSAEVGLGSTHRNVDSLRASVQLGVNGINIIMNGNKATIELNEDVIINNICSILPGPDITPDAVLQFTSDCCNTLRVTKDGILDLSGFTTGQVVEFIGNVKVVFEPGSTIIYGTAEGAGPTLRFAEQSTCLFEPSVNLNGIFNQDLTGTDTLRVVFTGIGILEFADCSRADLPRDAFVGVESIVPCQIFGADIRLHITDSAAFYIGETDCRVPGGVFQVGNTIPLGDGTDPLITFSLILDGPQAKFEIGPQGFLGLGVGVVNKPASGHDNWLVQQTGNLQRVTLDLQNGIFRHAQLYAGADDRSALIALGDSVNGGPNPFDFNSDPLPGTVPTKYSGPLLSNTNVLGGGNLIAALSAGLGAPFAPVVDSANGNIGSGQYLAGILASTPIIQTPKFQLATAAETQLLLRAQSVLDIAPTTNRGVAAPSDLLNQVRVGYVDTAGLLTDGVIARTEVRNIIGKTPQTSVQQHSLQLGTVQVSLEPTSIAPVAPRSIVNVYEIGN